MPYIYLNTFKNKARETDRQINKETYPQMPKRIRNQSIIC